MSCIEPTWWDLGRVVIALCSLTCSIFALVILHRARRHHDAAMDIHTKIASLLLQASRTDAPPRGDA